MATRFIGFGTQASVGRYPNSEFNGPGYVAGETPGLVTVNSVPSARFVFATHRKSHKVAASAFSNADGTYRLEFLNPDLEYDIIGRDWSGTYNDVIVSRVRPKPY